MKNHMRINGQLFQTNKKWSHLKEKQKDLDHGNRVAGVRPFCA